MEVRTYPYLTNPTAPPYFLAFPCPPVLENVLTQDYRCYQGPRSYASKYALIGPCMSLSSKRRVAVHVSVAFSGKVAQSSQFPIPSTTTCSFHTQSHRQLRARFITNDPLHLIPLFLFWDVHIANRCAASLPFHSCLLSQSYLSPETPEANVRRERGGNGR